jgi:monoamine oxidase
VDLVIVGAGAAGLGAAVTARGLGLEVLVLEAMDRIGGRAFTTNEPFGFPWDAGCHWLHSASVNPFTRIADREGLGYRSTPTPWHSWINGAVVSENDEARIDRFIEDALERAIERGRAGLDAPISEFADAESPWFDLFRYQINAEWGVNPGEASTLDLARYRDLDENWPVEDGYGALVRRAAASALADVQLNTPVTSIAQAPSCVRVSTPTGAIEAAAVIVTASTNVLAEGLIAFEPELPLWKREAFAAVPLGYANKIALQPAEAALAGMEEQNFAVPIGAGQMIGLRFRPFGRNVIDCYIAGPACSELESAGADAMVDVAIEASIHLLGSDLRRQILATAASSWGLEPYIRGAYAAAKPGMAELRADLGRPVWDRVYFAGEATSPKFFTTCHGAWETGIAAAQAIAATIGGSARHH